MVSLQFALGLAKTSALPSSAACVRADRPGTSVAHQDSNRGCHRPAGDLGGSVTCGGTEAGHDASSSTHADRRGSLGAWWSSAFRRVRLGKDGTTVPPSGAAQWVAGGISCPPLAGDPSGNAFSRPASAAPYCRGRGYCRRVSRGTGVSAHSTAGCRSGGEHRVLRGWDRRSTPRPGGAPELAGPGRSLFHSHPTCNPAIQGTRLLSGASWPRKTRLYSGGAR
jgi:hypothetical protein